MARIQLSDLHAPEAALPTAGAAQPRLWYVGLGLYDESWSEGDVTALASLLRERATGFQVVPLVLSYGRGGPFAPPDRADVDAATLEIARQARPSDVVLIYVSTHGAPGLLAREADGQRRETATIDEVNEWLAPLGRQPTVLVLSACFSGSFIPALRADNRIILAAARRDRTSFGCRAGADHTVFGEALLDALAAPRTSLHSIFATIEREVAARERKLRVSAPSEPQVFVGPAEAALYEARIF